MRSRRLLLAVASVFAMLSLAMLCGCGRLDSENRWTSELRSAHALADAAQTPSDTARARDALASAYEHAPKASSALPLRQDLTARLANLARNSGHAEDAVTWARRGLDEDGRPSVLRAQLLIELGEAQVSLRRNEDAKKTLAEAIHVNEELMMKELNTP